MIRHLLTIFCLLALACTLVLWIDSYRVRSHGPVAGPPFSSFSVDRTKNQPTWDKTPRGIWVQRDLGTRGFRLCSGNGYLGVSVYTTGRFTPGPADVSHTYLRWLGVGWSNISARGSFGRDLHIRFKTLLIAFALYPAATLARRVVVRAVRRRRGACVRCGYDLRGNVSGICPECATRLPERVENRS